ncbi:MAG: hypothetical protein KAV45_07200 [Calditrichia bacterium]|nr:hypothetical protein [Calditrichia bacterium]
MNPQVIIISKKNEPSLNYLLYALREHKIECHEIIHSRVNFNKIDTVYFRGFFIFCIPPSEIKKWLQNLDDRFLNYFKIYSYNYLIEDKIDTSVFLNFDFIIAGEQENGILHRQLDFLKSNYWRKIPFSKLGLKKVPDSKLIGKLFKILEKTDINITGFDQLSKKLNVSKEILRREIKKNLKIQYPELRSLLLDYYREYYPEKIDLLVSQDE